MIRMNGMGETVEGGQPGNLYIKVHVRAHPYLRKEGYNLVMDLQIKLSEALLGSNKAITTLDGEIEVKVPSGTNTGAILRIHGKGVPQGLATSKLSERRRGDLYIRINVKLPDKLSKEAKRLVEELKKEGV